MWEFLRSSAISGVSVRDMTVTVGDDFHELCPGCVVPVFKELVLPRTVTGVKDNGWVLDLRTIPEADMFTGVGMPLFVTSRIKALR